MSTSPQPPFEFTSSSKTSPCCQCSIAVQASKTLRTSNSAKMPTLTELPAGLLMMISSHLSSTESVSLTLISRRLNPILLDFTVSAGIRTTGASLLHAIRHQNIEATEYLLETFRVPLNQSFRFDHQLTLTTTYDLSPLQHAVLFASHDTVRLLVSGTWDRDLDINFRHPARGTTALHTAARLRDPRSLRILLEHGADVHARDHEGFTPLEIAVRRAACPYACINCSTDGFWKMMWSLIQNVAERL
jgi:hypothetical protein